MSQFEREIKNVLENYESPMDNGAWNDFNDKLNNNNKSSFFKQFIVAGVILTTAAVGLNQASISKEALAHDNHVIENSATDLISSTAVNQEEATTVSESHTTVDETKAPDLEKVVSSASEKMDIPFKVAVKKAPNNVLTAEEKENIIDINNNIDEISSKKPVIEYVGKNFNLNANLLLTPNGDGVNDYFMPEAIANGDDFLMKIFDNKGNVIFTTNQVSNPWKGYNQISGKDAEEGKYRWKVVLDSEKGKEIFNGSIRVE